ncbi:DUF4439 domain-containing protein [Arthrobacter sp. SO5]|uniref:DUF4439 domain-containing protein n=1 Tax=Arthrobacter sp. SO5 TaxID=1897055 RepID=UPI001E2E9874|nr:DUF4439 domain-containing protein [Arthrobacter sp. SO5]
MKDDTREKRWQELLPRVALLSILALVVVSLGVALTPGSPGRPAEPPFSEQARAAALTETLRLRAAGEQLGHSSPGTGQPGISQTVSLLTSQAQALQAPGQAPEPATEPGGSRSADPASPPAPLPSSAAALAAALAGSGSQRLADAAVADGGMARLLASVGTAQLLQASSVAAAAGIALPLPAVPAAPQPSGACAGAPATASSPAVPSRGAASRDAALAATVRTELETIYGYQVALTRLSGDAAKAASEQLARHEALAADAESLGLAHCAWVPAREAGYTLAPEFLASPGAGLAGLEAAALPVYGDLVALSEGETRAWAIAGMVGSARRAAIWGAETGPVPGLRADPKDFPPLPTADPAPTDPAPTEPGLTLLSLAQLASPAHW